GRETRWEQTALMWALASGHSQVARTLIEHDANINARSSGGFTPLLFAVQQDDLDSVRLLLAKGADLNYATEEHGNALTVATASGHEKLGLFLLEQGAEPDQPEAHGVTALHYTMAQGLSLINSLNYDPAYRMVPPSMHDLAKALLAKGANPNARIITRLRLGPDDPSTGMGMEGATPFFLAALGGDAEMLRVLAEHGADHTLTAKGETTSLMAAAGAARGVTQGTIKQRLGRPEEAVRVVVELGVDVHATRENGQTALHAAAFAGENEVIQYLVDHGARVEIEDNLGQTPWSMAIGISPALGSRGSYGSHPDTADLLLKLGAKPRSRGDMKIE
ncbi:MAG: ankyrin repeat domain-containing protein, partial [Acidobacteriota bacterium]|nr:ankyrin repeat domain-containing protein [Acidobacteriota bacterium]